MRKQNLTTTQDRFNGLLYNRIGVELPFATTTNFDDKILTAKKEYEKATFYN